MVVLEFNICLTLNYSTFLLCCIYHTIRRPSETKDLGSGATENPVTLISKWKRNWKEMRSKMKFNVISQMFSGTTGESNHHSPFTYSPLPCLTWKLLLICETWVFIASLAQICSLKCLCTSSNVSKTIYITCCIALSSRSHWVYNENRKSKITGVPSKKCKTYPKLKNLFSPFDTLCTIIEFYFLKTQTLLRGLLVPWVKLIISIVLPGGGGVSGVIENPQGTKLKIRSKFVSFNPF